MKRKVNKPKDREALYRESLSIGQVYDRLALIKRTSRQKELAQ